MVILLLKNTTWSIFSASEKEMSRPPWEHEDTPYIFFVVTGDYKFSLSSFKPYFYIIKTIFIKIENDFHVYLSYNFIANFIAIIIQIVNPYLWLENNVLPHFSIREKMEIKLRLAAALNFQRKISCWEERQDSNLLMCIQRVKSFHRNELLLRIHQLLRSDIEELTMEIVFWSCLAYWNHFDQQLRVCLEP